MEISQPKRLFRSQHRYFSLCWLHFSKYICPIKKKKNLEAMYKKGGFCAIFQLFGAASIDRFKVSHFRPVVMEIEIGHRSERSLGGQESAAVDQECMGSNASSCSFGLSFLIIYIQLSFFLPWTCRGQRIAPSNGKRNQTVELTFTKNITRRPYYTENNDCNLKHLCAPHGARTHRPKRLIWSTEYSQKKKKVDLIT